MKKVTTTLIAVIMGSMALTATAQAADLYCGANTEQILGSQVYNKLLYWEKTDRTKPSSRFLLADGTVLKSEELTPESAAKIADNSISFTVSFTEGRPQLLIGKVKRNSKNEINFTDVALSGPLDNSAGAFLVANGSVLMCKEL